MAKIRQIDDGQCNQLAWDFYNKQQEVKSLQKELDGMRAEFEDEMGSLCSKQKTSKLYFGGQLNNNVLSVSKIERTSIEWDADKLSERLPKSVARKVIRKQYKIANMSGLVGYLKSCGVDPKQFAKYLTAEQTVDQQAIDRLGELGEITSKDINGCYTVRCQKPYFKLSLKTGCSDGEA